MKEPFLVDSLNIKNNTIRLEMHQDGSLLFSDGLVNGVRLIDLLSANPNNVVVFNPAYHYTINAFDHTALNNDWEYNLSTGLYEVKLYHNWNLCDPEKVLVLVYNSQNILITVDTIQCFPNYVQILANPPIKMKVIIKKI